MSKRQQILLTLTLTNSLFFPFSLSFLLKRSINNSLICMIISYLLGLFIIYIVSKMKKDNIINKIFILLSSIILLLFSIYLLIIQVNNFYLPKTSPIFIFILLIMVIVYGTSKKLKGLARLNEIITPINIIIILFAIISNIKNFNINYLIIDYSFNINNIYLLLITTFISIIPIILFMYLYKEYNIKAIYKGYTYGFIISYFMLFTCITTLGITLSNLFEYPFYIVLKKIQLLDFIERIENILVIFNFTNIIIICIFLLLVIKKLIIKKKKYLN